MTTVENHPTEFYRLHSTASSDEHINPHRSQNPSTSVIAKNVPPAVPSPPPLSSRRSPPRKPRFPASVPAAVGMSSPEVEKPNQWIFTEAEISSTPSVLDGLPMAEERARRAKGVNFILQAGILLKLPQLTLATASVFFHRFYMRHSMVPEKGGLHHYVCYSSHQIPLHCLPRHIRQPLRGSLAPRSAQILRTRIPSQSVLCRLTYYSPE